MKIDMFLISLLAFTILSQAATSYLSNAISDYMIDTRVQVTLTNTTYDLRFPYGKYFDGPMNPYRGSNSFLLRKGFWVEKNGRIGFSVSK